MVRKLQRVVRELASAVGELRFANPVAAVYNPLEYAWDVHRQYLGRFGVGPKEVLFLGMNPGPYGMAQTGVPFGEIAAVREWLGLGGRIRRPDFEHPRRPVQGFACPRSEVSGRRLWSWAQRRAGTPERFFSRLFVHNYCPLAFMEESGRNLTPDKLPAVEREALFALCDEALGRVVELLGVSTVVGVGTFAEARARAALNGGDVRIVRLLHPSPASPAANRGWAEAADRQLAALGIAVP